MHVCFFILFVGGASANSEGRRRSAHKWLSCTRIACFLDSFTFSRLRVRRPLHQRMPSSGLVLCGRSNVAHRTSASSLPTRDCEWVLAWCFTALAPRGLSLQRLWGCPPTLAHELCSQCALSSTSASLAVGVGMMIDALAGTGGCKIQWYSGFFARRRARELHCRDYISSSFCRLRGAGSRSCVVLVRSSNSDCA